MNSNQISRIRLEGYKSIKECDLELKSLNVLIGPNGAGKSNFIGFFKFLQELIDGKLQRYLAKGGGPDVILHHGRKRTEKLRVEIHFGQRGYRVELEPTNDNRMMIASEAVISGSTPISWRARGGYFESTFGMDDFPRSSEVQTVMTIGRWRSYHFHDTGESAFVKQQHSINDNIYLRPDARNLAAFLFRLESFHYESYEKIVKTIRLVAPFFGDFRLRPSVNNSDRIELEWSEAEDDEPFKASRLSDGTLRFICLATVFLQPDEFQPEVILVDEPELGLHPYAIRILASLIRSTSKTKQVIVSTQSVNLLNEFEPADVIVADRKEEASVLRRIGPVELEAWLEAYTLGELWEKNILGGRPAR